MHKKVSQFVHDYMLRTGKSCAGEPLGPEYRWEHTLRVTYWAFQLATEEKADIDVCVTAALFHDVSHFACDDYRNHGIKSAEIAREYLTKEGYSNQFIKNVEYAIKSHVGDKNPQTREAKIIQDADTLDRFGYIRILLFGKRVDMSLEKLHTEVTSFLAYTQKVERGDYGEMWTKTGAKEVEVLINLYKVMLQGVLQEIRTTQPPETYL